MSSTTRDNWQRLVEAVMKREEYLHLCHKPYSRNPSSSTLSSDYSDQILSLESITASPSPHQVPPTKRPSIVQVNKNASPGLIARKLFSSWYRRGKGKDSYFADIPDGIAVLLGRIRRFSLREVKVATRSFSGKIVYQDGYGHVYKGWLADGSPVAVKRFNTTRYSDFQIEVEVYSIVVHPNILDVLGFCITKEERLLVHPLVAYGTVASWLRDRPADQPSLSWLTRKEIALGTARDLAYLHDECEKRIIHGDVKAANILLNEDFKPVIANFGLAIIVDHGSTDVFRDVICGTIGHIPPEYFNNHVCSEKTDVFGYGAFLLELITGQGVYELARVADDEGMRLLDWVKRNCERKQWNIMADPDCVGDDMEKVVEQLSVIALLCSQDSPDGRPQMSEIVRMLEFVDDNAEWWDWDEAEKHCNAS